MGAGPELPNRAPPLRLNQGSGHGPYLLAGEEQQPEHGEDAQVERQQQHDTERAGAGAQHQAGAHTPTRMAVQGPSRPGSALQLGPGAHTEPASAQEPSFWGGTIHSSEGKAHFHAPGSDGEGSAR